MKLLVFGDLQAHPWQEAERPDRVLDFIAVIDTIRRLAYKEAVDSIVFLGDLFESKRLIRADIVSMIYSHLSAPFIRKTEDGKVERIPFYAIAGNHDFHNGRCTLSPIHNPALQRFVFVDKPEMVSLRGRNFLFIPFNANDEPPILHKRFELAFIHCDLPNVSLAPGIVSKNNGLPPWINKVRAKMIIAGHYHTPGILNSIQGLPAIVLCGAPLEHNWKDVDSTKQRGVLLITVDETPNITRVPIGANFPRFYSADNLDVRPDIDFVLRPIVKTTAGTAIQHSGASIIAKGNSSQIVAAYLKHRRPDLSPQEFGVYFKAGMGLLNETHETEEC